MVVGFNHNFRYKGEVFHVQTEDGGLKSPHIITLLYRGGTILGSKKTSYSDIIKVDNLDQVVEELMKEQHRDMLRRLKEGEFDAVAGLVATAPAAPPPPVQASTAAATTPPPPAASTPPARPVVAAPTPPVAPPKPAVAPSAPVAPPMTAASTPPPATPPASPNEVSLDDIILSYMVGEDRK